MIRMHSTLTLSRYRTALHPCPLSHGSPLQVWGGLGLVDGNTNIESCTALRLGLQNIMGVVEGEMMLLKYVHAPLSLPCYLR